MFVLFLQYRIPIILNCKPVQNDNQENRQNWSCENGVGYKFSVLILKMVNTEFITHTISKSMLHSRMM